MTPSPNQTAESRVLLAGTLLLALIGAALSERPAVATIQPEQHLAAELLSEVREVAPGQSFKTGVFLTPEEGWHVYWRNPGDSGLAPSIQWRAPEGFSPSPPHFEAPARIPYRNLVNFGFEGPTSLITDWRVPSDLKPGSQVELKAEVRWLVCRQECLPGKASLSLKIQSIALGEASSRSRDALGAARIEAASLRLPRPGAADAGVSMQLRSFREKESGRIWLEWSLRSASTKESLGTHASFFPDGNDFEASAKQWRRPTTDGSINLLAERKSEARSNSVKGVMVIRRSDGNVDRSFEVNVPVPAISATLTRAQLLHDVREPGPEPKVGSTAPEGLIVMLAFAFLGGLILNLMPCIFPVLSIKILAFVDQGSKQPGAIQRHGWAFAFGVMTSFWILSALLFSLKSAGVEVGWGFQLQSPVFVAILALLFFLMALNLLGAFEVGGRIMGLGSSLTLRKGYSGSFLSGVLAVVAATPCSAPFMTTALGFGLSQPAWIGTLILTGVGAGLAAPYLLLSLRPSWLKALPRPGRWMETFRQALAFPLLLTTLWLLWVLAAQSGTEGVIRALGLLVLAYFLVWLKGRLPTGRRGLGVWAMTALLLLSLWIYEGWLRIRAIPTISARSGIQSTDAFATAWKKFSRQALEEARQAGKPVFVDFTADWCVTCKVNEKLVLNTDYLQQAFSKHGVVLFKADWTNNDPEITRALAEVGRNSVPVYLWYAPGAAHPEILPQLLSAGGIVARLEQSNR